MHRTVLLLSCPMLIFAVGCGKQTTVGGSVTYEGRPVAKGAITFLPADGQGPSCGAPIANGHYDAQLPPGRKIVRIVEMKTPDRIPTREELEQAAAKRRASGAADAEQAIPPNAEGNNVEIEVAPGSHTFDFSLKRPAGHPAARQQAAVQE